MSLSRPPSPDPIADAVEAVGDLETSMLVTGSPSRDAFRAPLLHVVGDVTLYRLTESARPEVVIPRVLRILKESRPADPKVHDLGLREFIAELDQIQASLDRDHVLATAYTLTHEGLLSIRKKGRPGWSLTQDSVSDTMGLRSHYSDKNVTTAWLDRHLDQTFRSGLMSHLALKCRRSVTFNEIDDLVHGFLCKLQERDTLRGRIERGRYPTPADLRAWMYRAALTVFRDQGRDALTRSFKGARHERDLDRARKGLEAEAHIDGDANQVVMLSETEQGDLGPMVTNSWGRAHGAPVIDVVDGDLESEVAHRDAMEHALYLIDDALRQVKRGSPERYARVGRLRASGYGSHEVSNTEGVSRNRAASLISEARLSLERTIRAEVARAVLEYLDEEPCATADEVVEDVEGATRLLIELLITQGRIERGRGGSLQITACGVAMKDCAPIDAKNLGLPTT